MTHLFVEEWKCKRCNNSLGARGNSLVEEETVWLRSSLYSRSYLYLVKMSVVDDKLELMDPTPDIHQLFSQFDRSYFWGELTDHCVVLEWSSRMTAYVGHTHTS